MCAIIWPVWKCSVDRMLNREWGYAALSNHKSLIALLILLSLLGQSVSYASAPCAMKYSSGASVAELPISKTTAMAMADMNHCGNDVAADPTPPQKQLDCCDQDDNCPMSGCVSAALPADTLIPVNHQAPSGAVNLYAFAFTNPIPTSFYRPPISR